QLKVLAADLFDIGQVLTRDIRHGYVQHIEILLADQVQQKIQRTLEGFQKDFEGVRRDVEILRQVEQRLAVQASQSHGIDRVDRAVLCRRHQGIKLALGSCAGDHFARLSV